MFILMMIPSSVNKAFTDDVNLLSEATIFTIRVNIVMILTSPLLSLSADDVIINLYMVYY